MEIQILIKLKPKQIQANQFFWVNNFFTPPYIEWVGQVSQDLLYVILLCDAFVKSATKDKKFFPNKIIDRMK